MICPIGNDVQHAASILQKGGLVAFATETVYGLGADALSPHAVARVFEVKDRPRLDPLIVHVADVSEFRRLGRDIPPDAFRLADAFWPGPLTLVVCKADVVPDIVTAGLPTVAVRIPAHPQALELLRASGRPIAAPSANRFGRLSPTTAEHVAEQLGEKIDYILDGGPCKVGVESTVIALPGEERLLLRPGGLAVEEIEAVIGPLGPMPTDANSPAQPQISPGRLPRHYAPRTPLVVQSAGDPLPASADRTGLLTLREISDPSPFCVVETLSQRGDLTEAAAGFFAALRRLDAEQLDIIVAEPFPEHGLGRALNDRLRRAAHKR